MLWNVLDISIVLINKFFTTYKENKNQIIHQIFLTLFRWNVTKSHIIQNISAKIISAIVQNAKKK